MTDPQPNNPLHGITLERMLNELVAALGWAELGRLVAIRCFTHDPSLPSSLKFLRRTPWARDEVEALYVRVVGNRSAPLSVHHGKSSRSGSKA